jgi:hypothetical protein
MSRPVKVSYLRFSTASRRSFGSSRLGGIMPLHFQVYADFTVTSGKPQLVSTSISNTYAACTTLPFLPIVSSNLTISRIFPTLRLANSYIAYLHGVYPHSPAPPPVLDANQKNLFLSE